MSRNPAFVFMVILLFGLSAVVSATRISITDAAPPVPPRPTLSDSWYDPNLTLFDGQSASHGATWYDGSQNFFKNEYKESLLGWATNDTIIIRNTETVLIVDGVCHNFAMGLKFPFWSWVSNASYNGQVMVDGRGPCDEWIYTTSNGTMILDVIDNGTLPVRFYASMGLPPLTLPNCTLTFSPSFVAENYTDENVSAIFEFPQECFSLQVCPAGPVMNETFYLYHQVNDFSLANVNVADQLGKVASSCIGIIFNVSFDSWVSEYNLTVNTTWGQFGDCDSGFCWGGAFDRVGREAVEGAAPRGGQCSANTNLGNLYSLPPYNESLCPGGGLGSDPVYTEANGTVWSGCGWKVAEKIKTIEKECLDLHGLAEACLADNGYPWATARAIWVQAFASEDVSNGGCPSIATFNANP